MLKEKLEYIKYIYESINHKYMSQKFVFIYKKDKQYFYGSSYETLIKVDNVDDLLKALEHYDLDKLELYVDDIILNYCVYMKQSLAKAMKFVSEEQITSKEKSLKEFFEVLKEKIDEQMIDNKKAISLKLIKD